MAPVEAPDDPVFSDGRNAGRLEKRDFPTPLLQFPIRTQSTPRWYEQWSDTKGIETILKLFKKTRRYSKNFNRIKLWKDQAQSPGNPKGGWGGGAEGGGRGGAGKQAGGLERRVLNSIWKYKVITDSYKI